ADVSEPVEGLSVVMLIGAARPKAELVGKVVVQPAVELVIPARRFTGQEIVVLEGESVGRWSIRFRPVRQQVNGYGVHPGSGDLVPGERQPVAVGLGGQRIVKQDILAGAVLQTREVAGPPGIDRHSGGRAGSIQRSNALFAKEEKGPVPAVVKLGNENRPAHR